MTRGTTAGNAQKEKKKKGEGGGGVEEREGGRESQNAGEKE